MKGDFKGPICFVCHRPTATVAMDGLRLCVICFYWCDPTRPPQTKKHAVASYHFLAGRIVRFVKAFDPFLAALHEIVAARARARLWR